MFVFLCLTSPCMQSLGPSMWLQVALLHLYGRAVLHCVYYYISFIHSSVDGHLGCIHVLAAVNRASENTGVHVTFRIRVLSRYMPRSGIAGSYDKSSFYFLSYLHIIFHNGGTSLNFHQQCRMIPFSLHHL